MTMIRVKNRVNGKEYTCREKDFISARKKGAALVKIGVVEPTPPKTLSFEEKLPGEDKPKPKPKKRSPKKKKETTDSVEKKETTDEVKEE